MNPSHWSVDSKQAETDYPCNCPNVSDGRSGWELCPIARRAVNYEADQEIFDHLKRYSHGCPSPCRYGRGCNSFCRLQNNSNRLSDLIHIICRFHPARLKNEGMARGYNPLSYAPADSQFRRTTAAGTASCDAKTRAMLGFQMDHDTDYLTFLIIEVIENGKARDLAFSQYDQKKQPGLYEDEMREKERKLIRYAPELIRKLGSKGSKGSMKKYLDSAMMVRDVHPGIVNLMGSVTETLRDPRHTSIGSPLNHGEMLAVILYTGCASNYDLCAEQRRNLEHDTSAEQRRRAQRGGRRTDVRRWDYFEVTLQRAINKLDGCDTYSKSVPVYSGLSQVVLSGSEIRTIKNKGGKFSTFVSTSRRLEVAKQFLGAKGGLLFRIMPELQQHHDMKCCDISWISKFGEREAEVLFCFGDDRQRWTVTNVCEGTVNGNPVQFLDLEHARPSYDDVDEWFYKFGTTMPGAESD